MFTLNVKINPIFYKKLVSLPLASTVYNTSVWSQRLLLTAVILCSSEGLYMDLNAVHQLSLRVFLSSCLREEETGSDKLSQHPQPTREPWRASG